MEQHFRMCFYVSAVQAPLGEQHLTALPGLSAVRSAVREKAYEPRLSEPFWTKTALTALFSYRL